MITAGGTAMAPTQAARSWYESGRDLGYEGVGRGVLMWGQLLAVGLVVSLLVGAIGTGIASIASDALGDQVRRIAGTTNLLIIMGCPLMAAATWLGARRRGPRLLPARRAVLRRDHLAGIAAVTGVLSLVAMVAAGSVVTVMLPLVIGAIYAHRASADPAPAVVIPPPIPGSTYGAADPVVAPPTHSQLPTITPETARERSAHLGEVLAQRAEAAADPEPEEAEDIKDLLEELDQLVGLDEARAEIHQLIRDIRIAAERQAHGLDATVTPPNLRFEGPPGTGKTTLAQLIARVYRALGLLPRGHLVEASERSLVAGYVGQTAAKTSAVIDRALGGVLFIDEAYALAPQAGGSGPDFGLEAINTLVERMDRDRLAVIVAGYPAEMRELIASNPGLASRFDRVIRFAPYGVEDLAEIARRRLVAERDLDEGAGAALADVVERAHRLGSADPTWGNAREMRRLVETIIRAQSARLGAEKDLSREQLQTIRSEDVESGYRQYARTRSGD